MTSRIRNSSNAEIKEHNVPAALFVVHVETPLFQFVKISNGLQNISRKLIFMYWLTLCAIQIIEVSLNGVPLNLP